MNTIFSPHCSGGTPNQWRPLAERVRGEARLFAPPALIGYDPDEPWDPTRGPGLDDEARRIENLLDVVPGPVDLVGHSYGGAVALRVALRRPERVRRLVVSEPALFSLLAISPRDRAAAEEIVTVADAIREALEEGRSSRAAGLFVDYWSGKGVWDRLDERRRAYVESRMVKVVAEFDALAGDRTPLSAYARLRMPVLWLEGGHSPAPVHAVRRQLLPVLPDARVERLPDADHMGPVTRAAEVAEIVAAFLFEDAPEAMALAA